MGKPSKAKATRWSAAIAIAVTVMTMMAATMFAAGKAEAATASIAWDAPANSTGIAGYKVHIGSTSRNYQQHVDVGNTTSYSTSTLSDGATYYFAVTAYNGSKVESAYSNEIVRTIAAAPVTHTITATAGAGGSITPLNNTKVSSATGSGSTITSVTVADGASQGFSIAPAAGYRIADVKVNGASVGAVASYTFAAVKSAQSISATFAAATTSYTITASAGTGGSITPAGTSTVTSGGSKSYTIAPAAGYRIAGVTVNGASVGAVASYTFANVTGNQTIAATFAAATTSYTITATAGTGGSISPAGSVSVPRGTSKSFTIAPNSGYRIKSLQVDGKWIAAASTYTFSNVTANHSILAAFEATTTASYTITASAGTGGSITPAGTSTVTSGGSRSYTIAPAAGYRIAGVTVNGASVGAVASYTFANVTRNQTIAATFAAATTSYTITATAGNGGTITPAGSVSVSRGTSRTFTITPNSGYKIQSLQVDGKWITAASTYTFSNVTANHSILAAFTATTATAASSTSTAGRVVFATNGGGTSYKDGAGVTYGADSRFSGGSVKTATVAVANTTDDTLYHSYRYGNSFSYNIPLASGAYSVVLKFADNSGVGQRVFDVKAEGLTALSNFDIYARAGNNTAYEVTLPVNVTDGTLNLGFASRIGNAKVNAIVVKTR